jgi:virginiamycin B lyase
MRRSLLTLIILSACTGQAEDTTLSPSTVPLTATSTTSADITATTSTTPAITITPTTQPDVVAPGDLVLESFPAPAGSGPHDVAPALDGGVWYTAQDIGELGWLDPATGETRHTALGEGSAPHGVIIDEAGTAWITDGGLNTIVAVDPVSLEVTAYPLPEDRPDANLNTASFDGAGMLWFTGQNGIYGCVDPDTGEVIVFGLPHRPDRAG